MGFVSLIIYYIYAFATIFLPAITIAGHFMPTILTIIVTVIYAKIYTAISNIYMDIIHLIVFIIGIPFAYYEFPKGYFVVYTIVLILHVATIVKNIVNTKRG